MKGKRTLLKATALVALVMLCAPRGTRPARAQAGAAEETKPGVTCEETSKGKADPALVSYYGPFYSTSTDLRATRTTDDPRADAAYKVELKGYLYYPGEKVKEAPVIIFNHGHEQDRGKGPGAIARYFTRRGFVVFAPLRRGHFYEDDDHPENTIRSTGVHIDKYVNKCMRSHESALGSDLPQLYCGSDACRPEVSCLAFNRDNALQVGYLREQREDVREQVRFIKGLPAVGEGVTGKLADPKRIAILGHSFGGALMVFANEFDYGQAVAIDVSGAELSWGEDSPFWEHDLRDAMDSQARPLYFLQPKNGRSLLPTKILFGKAVNKGYLAQGAIFPPAFWDPICDGHKSSCWDEEKGEVKPYWKQAHSNFIGRADAVVGWGCTVIEFLDRNRLP